MVCCVQLCSAGSVPQQLCALSSTHYTEMLINVWKGAFEFPGPGPGPLGLSKSLGALCAWADASPVAFKANLKIITFLLCLWSRSALSTVLLAPAWYCVTLSLNGHFNGQKSVKKSQKASGPDTNWIFYCQCKCVTSELVVLSLLPSVHEVVLLQRMLVYIYSLTLHIYSIRFACGPGHRSISNANVNCKNQRSVLMRGRGRSLGWSQIPLLLWEINSFVKLLNFGQGFPY